MLNDNKLPTQDLFHGVKDDKKCSDYEYWVATTVWTEPMYKMNNLKSFHNHYLRCDVCLLQDFFEKFRGICMENFNLEPLKYFSTPGLAFDAALKYSGVELQLLDNAEMYTMIERGIRGGVSQITLREASANNELMENWNSENPLVHLIYLDCTNLYGTVMVDKLPTHGFRWIENDARKDVISYNFDKKLYNMTDIDLNGDCGYILEVDLKIPEKIHDETNDMPLAPEEIVVNKSMLSPYQQTFPDIAKVDSSKLAPNMFDKTKYVLHAKNLSFYEKMGVEITNVHRIIEFKQSSWLASYINFNTKKRAESKSMFAKNFYKLLNNSVYGKCVENVRKRIKVKMANTKSQAVRIASHPNMLRSMELREDLVIFETRIEKLSLAKPIYVGMSILDLSKLYMMKFHYEKMRQWFKTIDLCFTDTDSLLYRIEDQNIYDVFKENEEWFDFSEYPKNHQCYSSKNKKKLGTFKDELQSQILLQFIGLRAKSYSIMFNDFKGKDTEYQVAKGTKSEVRKRYLKHKHYQNVLKNLTTIYVKQNTIQSIGHKIGTYNQERKALTGWDTKRYIKKCGVKTLAHGHYLTNTNC